MESGVDKQYLGWSIHRWHDGKYGVWYPDGHNTERQFPSLTVAKRHIREIETAINKREAQGR